mmetsp:Transcript_59390/g.105617  ORF Transcript_59390/g.105617 Transcript_59390/m.105617 type:complete len:198 (-) Transcript_59390:26-619(-)
MTTGLRMSRAVNATILSRSGVASQFELSQAHTQARRLLRRHTSQTVPVVSQGSTPIAVRGRPRSAPLLGEMDPRQPQQERRTEAPSSSVPSEPRSSQHGGYMAAEPAQADSQGKALVGDDKDPIKAACHKARRAGKALFPVEACIILQRWWQKHLRLQKELFENLVVELMELRREAALEVQRAWRAFVKRKAALPRS